MYAMRDNAAAGVVRLPVEKQGKCPICGRLATRTHTFTAPVRVDGIVRAAAVVMAELKVLRDAWLAKPATHAKCESPTPD